MSWSLNKSGSKDDVQKYLDEEAPKMIGHVQGVERSIADATLGLLRAVAAANTNPDKYGISLSASGHAVCDEKGDQQSHNLSVSVSYMSK